MTPDNAGDRPWPLALVGFLAAACGTIALFLFYSHGLTHLYSDGVYRLLIARKIVDIVPGESLWQRYLQLGTPWLPLPHVLVLPLVWDNWLWRSGMAGSLVSLLAYAGAAVALFRLAWRLRAGSSQSVAPVWLSTSVFALNPSLLYLQATPMTEALFLLLLVLGAERFVVWIERPSRRRLVTAAAVMTLGALTRYEGWAVLAAAGCLVLLAPTRGRRRLEDGLLWAALASLAPIYWLWHNWAIFGSPIAFLVGPYSARAQLFADVAGWHDQLARGLRAAWNCVTPVVAIAATLGFLASLRTDRLDRRSVAALALLLVPFGLLLVGLLHGEIQIHFERDSLYNVRYAIAVLPAAALLAPVALELATPVTSRRTIPFGWLVAIAAAVLGQYGWVVAAPATRIAVMREPILVARQSGQDQERLQVADYLRRSPPRGLLLVYTGELGAILAPAGLPLASVVHEGTTRWWALPRRIPDGVSTVVMSDTGVLAHLLKACPEFPGDFVQVYASGSGPRWHVWERAGAE